jgi:hypothetical protein
MSTQSPRQSNRITLHVPSRARIVIPEVVVFCLDAVFEICGSEFMRHILAARAVFLFSRLSVGHVAPLPIPSRARAFGHEQSDPLTATERARSVMRCKASSILAPRDDMRFDWKCKVQSGRAPSRHLCRRCPWMVVVGFFSCVPRAQRAAQGGQAAEAGKERRTAARPRTG